MPSLRTFYEALAERHEVIRLDQRGAGLSGAVRPTVDEVARDVEAVADAVGHPRFDLMASGPLAAVGIRLATTKRVGRLVLCDPLVTAPEAKDVDQFLRAAEAMTQADASELISLVWISVGQTADADALRSVVEENVRVHPEIAAADGWSGRQWLGDVVAPTLVMYTRDGGVITSNDQAREAAATIPDVKLVGINGASLPYMGARDEVLAAVGDFLGWEASGEQGDLLGDEQLGSRRH